MLDDDALSLEDIDPLNRHKNIGKTLQTTLNVCIVAQDGSVKKELDNAGIHSTELSSISTVKIMYPNELAKTLNCLGANEKLGLTGRPKRRMRALRHNQTLLY